MPASTPVLSILMFVLAALLGAVGQYLYKSGADASSGSLLSFVANWRILTGVVCYVAVMVLFVGAFKKGGALHVLYPVYASTFIWGAILAWIAYGTQIRPVHLAGMALLVLGMYLMGR